MVACLLPIHHYSAETGFALSFESFQLPRGLQWILAWEPLDIVHLCRYLHNWNEQPFGELKFWHICVVPVDVESCIRGPSLGHPHTNPMYGPLNGNTYTKPPPTVSPFPKSTAKKISGSALYHTRPGLVAISWRKF